MIKQQNDHIATLNAKLVEHELENENFKFARSMLYNGRCPGIKDGIGFQQGNQNNTKLNAPKKLSNFVKDKAPMAQDRYGYILCPANYPEHKIRKIHARKPHSVSHHAFMYKNKASSSMHTTKVKMPKKKIPNASNEHNISFKTFDASYVLTNKSGKIVAKYVGANTRVQGYRVFKKSTRLVEVSCDIVFDETNSSKVEQVDLDELDDEEALCVALRNMSIGDVCPKESEEPTQAQDQPSSSMQASPPTQDEDEAHEEENEDQDNEPPQEEDFDLGGDEDDQYKEDDQEIRDQRPPHPRVHQAIQRDHPVNSILGDIHKGLTTRS
jgi:hypothetical protein